MTHKEDMDIVYEVMDETKEVEMDLPFEDYASLLPAGSRINFSDSTVDSLYYDATIVRYIRQKGQKTRVVVRVPIGYLHEERGSRNALSGLQGNQSSRVPNFLYRRY